MKLVLIRVYYQLGVFLRPLESHVPSLEIKQILFDSMSWVYTEGIEYLASGEKLNEALGTVQNTMNIYARNEIETTDMMILAYENGTYSKIFEFLSFRDWFVGV
jgi:N-terminal acetyltransferase B complex non-catalytic subunit